MLDLLFVYGTLRSAFDNPCARMLRAEGRMIALATASGSVFQMGHYPGWRPDPPGEVHGELYRLADPTRTLKDLDEYEGPDFSRVLTRVSTGEDAWIYRVESRPPLDTRIVSGDFLAP